MTPLTWLILTTVTSVAGFECDRNAEHCTTYLDINYAYAMVSDTEGPVISKDRKLYVDYLDNHEVKEPERVITLDGFQSKRVLIVANGTIPAPPIISYENQKVTVVVRNHLHNQAVSIHWHGIDQIGTPFMDGVSFITQCPISPGQSFNYTFTPRHGGTHWYHSHQGTQKDAGLYGAFVVLRKNENIDDVGNILTVGEWDHKYDDIAMSMSRMMRSAPDTVLVNGKAEFETNEAPLHVFHAKSGDTIRFRAIGMGAAKPHMLSIDGHQINIIETDGSQVESMTVDRLIIYPGERFDFTVNVGFAGIYKIPVHMMQGSKFKFMISGLALLNVTENDPSAFQPNIGEKLKVLNCPFKHFPNYTEFECLTVTELRAADQHIDESDIMNFPDDIRSGTAEQTFFLNFGSIAGDSVNTYNFKWPTVSAISQPSEIIQCNAASKNECSQSIALKKGAIVNIVISTLGSGSINSHPVHMHGYHFRVLKMGIPHWESLSGPNFTLIGNEDIECEPGVINELSECDKANWRNKDWSDLKKIPGLNINRPIRKDTVMIPKYGYTLVRFKASNPGIWLLHCHIDAHMAKGMVIMLNESFEDFNRLESYTVPPSYPVCRGFMNDMPLLNGKREYKLKSSS